MILSGSGLSAYIFNLFSNKYKNITTAVNRKVFS